MRKRCGYRKRRTTQRGAGLFDFIKGIFGSVDSDETKKDNMQPMSSSVIMRKNNSLVQPAPVPVSGPPPTSQPPFQPPSQPPSQNQATPFSGGKRSHKKRSTKRKH